MSLLPSAPMAFHCTENKQARAQALMMWYGTCPDGCVYLRPVSSSLLLGSRLLSQVSTHWSIGLGLSSVTFPHLVPVILQISAKHHILRTSSLTTLSRSTLYSIPVIFYHIIFFPSWYSFNHNQQLSSLYIYLFISSFPSWNLSSMRTQTLLISFGIASPISPGIHHRYSNKDYGMNE